MKSEFDLLGGISFCERKFAALELEENSFFNSRFLLNGGSYREAISSPEITLFKEERQKAKEVYPFSLNCPTRRHRVMVFSFKTFPH